MFLTLLSPKNCDSEAGFLIGSFSHIPRPFWRLEMHQSTLVTARWFASWFEASTWVFFYNQSVCCSRSTDVLCVIYIYMYFYCHFFLYSLLTLYWTLVHQEICCRFGCPLTSFVHSGLMLVPCKHVTTCIYSYRFSNKELLVDLHKHCLGNWVTQLSCGVTYLTSRTAMLTLGSLWLLHQVTNSTCSSLHVLIVL